MGKKKKKKKPHPQPLSEPTVTDRREVMERGVESNVCHTLEQYKNKGDKGKWRLNNWEKETKEVPSCRRTHG